MTEDDTFNALRRTPFINVLMVLGDRAGTPEMLDITKSVWSTGNENLDPAWLDFFKMHGWSVQEFEKECKKK